MPKIRLTIPASTTNPGGFVAVARPSDDNGMPLWIKLDLPLFLECTMFLK